jgi:hypothetical protein
MSSLSASQPSPSGKATTIDPVLRNALRYTISAKEYELLHQYLLSRAPAVKKRTPNPEQFEAVAKGSDDYNVAAVRASLRLGIVTFSGLKAWELITTKLLARGPAKKYGTDVQPHGAEMTNASKEIHPDRRYGNPPPSA